MTFLTTSASLMPSAFACCGICLSTSGVRTKPGQITLACTPYCASNVVTLLAPGKTYDFGWPGTVFVDQWMPPTCYGEAGCVNGPCLKEVGVRTRVWTVAGLGHAIPSDKTLAEAVRWMEEGLARRRAMVKIQVSKRALPLY